MLNMQDRRIFVYQIDADDKIVIVNRDWLSFASENVYDVSEKTVINQRLWDFIVDWETQELYKILLDKVRNQNASLTVPFRCDSPDCRRFMELEVYAPQEDLVEFKSRIVKLEIRNPVNLLDIRVDRSSEFVVMCGWCKKVLVDEKYWLEVEEAIHKLSLFEAAKLPQLTHTICPACYDNVLQLSNLGAQG